MEVSEAMLQFLINDGMRTIGGANYFMKLASIQQAILRRLRDDDLSVVRAALSLDGLTRVISLPDLLEALCDTLLRCAEIASHYVYKSGDLTKRDRAVAGILGVWQHAMSIIKQLPSTGIIPQVFSF